MKRTSSRLLLAALIASASTLALAQPLPCPQGIGPGPAATQEQRIAFYQDLIAELEARLVIGSGQESVWNTWIEVMHPPDQPLRLLPFAERQDLIAAREAATIALHAALTPEQQAIFDAYTAQYRMLSAIPGGMGGGGGKGGGKGGGNAKAGMGGGGQGGGMGGGGQGSGMGGGGQGSGMGGGGRGTGNCTGTGLGTGTCRLQ